MVELSLNPPPELPAQHLKTFPGIFSKRPRCCGGFCYQPFDDCFHGLAVNKEFAPKMARFRVAGRYKNAGFGRHVLIHWRRIGRHDQRPAGQGLDDIVAPAFRT